MMDRLIKQADFSKETDLKQRLYSRLFAQKVVQFPGARAALNDDLLDMVNAAGNTDLQNHDPLK